MLTRATDDASPLGSAPVDISDAQPAGVAEYCWGAPRALMKYSADPFRHWVIDDWCPRELLRAALAEWPDRNWMHWHLYDDLNALKYATRDASHIPPACAQVMRRMASLPVEAMTGLEGLFPDLSLHGAGLHMLPPGGFLNLHWDAERHPLRPWLRKLSGTLFVNERWLSEWGGALEFWSHDGAGLMTQCEPRFGRLVLFDTSPASLHGVPRRITCPDDDSRKSLSLFWWSFGATSGRCQSEFLQ